VTVLAAPPGKHALPGFDEGWLIGEDRRAPFLSYAEAAAVNWSDALESLHEESSRTHFIDVWTRDAILERVGNLRGQAVVVDLGCSTGYLLEDLRKAHPDVMLIGVDLVASGLLKAHALIPSARLVQADACELPLADESVDAVLSANLLEHVPDDRRALAEIRRVMRPGAQAAIVVPAGPGTYDYYDRFLGHERRYARGELARKAADAGLDVIEDGYIASLLYPAFWLVKQRNRRRYGHLKGEALEQRVARDIANTRDSRVGRALRRVEEGLGLRLPFGVRNVVVLRRGAP
jgi:SAM-dependent methyltransferase